MVFLQKGTLRCELSLEAVINRKWLELTPNGYKQLPCPFHIQLGQDQKSADFWLVVQFMKNYDLSEIEGVRAGRWRFAFTVVGDGPTCGLYHQESLTALVDRTRGYNKDGSIDTEVEVVSNDLEAIKNFCLDLRRGNVEPNQGDAWDSW